MFQNCGPLLCHAVVVFGWGEVAGDEFWVAKNS